MKRFDIITESDARVLPPGEPVMLARGGHVTPLAQDTLEERRIAIVHEGRASADEASLAPVAEIRSLAIASDHTGVKLRQMLVAFLRGRAVAISLTITSISRCSSSRVTPNAEPLAPSPFFERADLREPPYVSRLLHRRRQPHDDDRARFVR